MHFSVCLIHSLYSEAVQNPYRKNYATCGRTEQYSEHNNSPNYEQVNLYIKFKILKTIDIYLQLTNFTISSSSIKIFLHFPINFQAYQTRSNTSLPCLCNPDRFCFHSKKKIQKNPQSISSRPRSLPLSEQMLHFPFCG